jgi:hypothetical protein
MTLNVDVVLKHDPASHAFHIAVHHPPGRPPQQLLDALFHAGWAKSPDVDARIVRGKTVLLLSHGGQPASDDWSDAEARAHLAQRAHAVLRRFGFSALTLDAA